MNDIREMTAKEVEMFKMIGELREKNKALETALREAVTALNAATRYIDFHKRMRTVPASRMIPWLRALESAKGVLK